jgi:proteasome lid subunit RPN8/RPN11
MPPQTQPEPQPLRIPQRAFEQILAHARAAAPDECLGLLVSRAARRSRVITGAALLPADSSPAHACATPQAIAETVARLREHDLVIRGIFHSHGESGVHHSAIDDATMARLLPGMAEDNFERPAPPHLAPVVVAPDEARLPLADGTAQVFSLLGPPIDGLDAREAAAWSSITTRFLARSAAPHAVHRAGFLDLYGGQAVLSLGVPAHATVGCRLVDASAVRVATMYSLVVNSPGEAYAEALTVWEVAGRTFTEMGPCSVEIIADSGTGYRRTTQP